MVGAEAGRVLGEDPLHLRHVALVKPGLDTCRHRSLMSRLSASAYFELNSGLRIAVLYSNNISFTEQLSVQLRVLCVGQLVAALLAPPRPRVPGPGVGVEPGLALELETKVHAKGIIMEKAPTRAFSWLKAPTSAFTFKNTIKEHYAKQM